MTSTPATGLAIIVLTLCPLWACGGKQPTPDAPAKGGASAGERKEAPAERPYCEPGQVNDLGVGRRCTTHAECRGFKASMCSFFKGPDRPRMCIIHCDADEQCGPDAMCGLVRGWIRACFPKRCKDFAYAPERVRPLKHPPAARHEGAVVVDPGFAFTAQGWGNRCADEAACKGLTAAHCNVAIYPAGVGVCGSECRGSECGDNAYCSYDHTRGFSLCLPRSPAERHRALKTAPAQLGRCKMFGTIVDSSVNESGIGKPCTSSAQCKSSTGKASAAIVCGTELKGPRRKPDSCTRACNDDKDCGRNAVCLDLDRGLADRDDNVHARYCVPACWAI